MALLVGMSGMATAQDGRVSVYTAHKAEIIERLIPEFEKATGLTADIVKAGSGDIINRVRAESANPQADVIWSIGAELLEANGDLLEAYQPEGSDLDRPGLSDGVGLDPLYRHPHRAGGQHRPASAGRVPEDLDRSRRSAL